MLRRYLLACALLIFFVAPANAYPPDEQAVVEQVGQAVVASIFQDTAAAVAECEAARKLITPASPKYIAFHIERCLGLVSEDGGAKGGKRCPHFKNALAIWSASPAKIDPNDEDSALTRAKFVREMKEEVASYCTPGGAPPKKADPNALIFAPRTGAVLETQEGIAYALPDGFGVQSFDPDSGLANLRNPATGMSVRIERTSLQDSFYSKEKYPEQEKLSNGAVMEWRYLEFIPGAKTYVLYAKVTLANAYIVLGASGDPKISPAGVDKDAGLAVFRAIANSVRVIGPRRCIGECGPGVLK